MLAALLLSFSFIGFLKGLMMFFFILSAILLMVVVLLQEPKGGGLSSAFGGMGAETFGVQTGSVNKFTSWVAGIFILLAILYAAVRPPEATGKSHRDEAPGAGAPAQPAPPAAPPAAPPDAPPARDDTGSK